MKIETPNFLAPDKAEIDMNDSEWDAGDNYIDSDLKPNTHLEDKS